MSADVLPQESDLRDPTTHFFAFTVATLGEGAGSVRIRRAFRSRIVAGACVHWTPAGLYAVRDGQEPVALTEVEVGVLRRLMPVRSGLIPSEFEMFGAIGPFLAQAAAVPDLTPGAPFTDAAIQALFAPPQEVFDAREG